MNFKILKIIIIVSSQRRNVISISLLIFSPFRGFLIHAIDIVVEHFLLFFAQIGNDTLFPKKFIAQLLTQSKCMHIARECTAKRINLSISICVQRAFNSQHSTHPNWPKQIFCRNN